MGFGDTWDRDLIGIEAMSAQRPGNTVVYHFHVGLHALRHQSGLPLRSRSQAGADCNTTGRRNRSSAE